MPTINTWNSNIPVELTKGGTNATSMSTSTGIVKYDGTRLVTSSTATIDANNLYTNTSQHRFSAYVSANILNVTGAGATYTIIFDSEDYDVGSNYNTASGVFTCSKAGIYLFTHSVLLTGNPNTNYIISKIIVTGNSYVIQHGKTSDGNDTAEQISCIHSMAAGDTAYCTIYASGGAGNTSDVGGAATGHQSRFQGVLLT